MREPLLGKLGKGVLECDGSVCCLHGLVANAGKLLVGDDVEFIAFCYLVLGEHHFDWMLGWFAGQTAVGDFYCVAYQHVKPTLGLLLLSLFGAKAEKIGERARFQ